MEMLDEQLFLHIMLVIQIIFIVINENMQMVIMDGQMLHAILLWVKPKRELEQPLLMRQMRKQLQMLI